MPLSNTAKLNEIISFLQALEGLNSKAELVSVLGSPAVGTDDFATLITRIQTIKSTMANNLVNKGQTAVGTDTLANLATKIASIILGKKSASGTITSASSASGGFQYHNGSGASANTVTVSGLTFLPSLILLTCMGVESVLPAIWKSSGLYNAVSYGNPSCPMQIGNNFYKSTGITVDANGFYLPVGNQNTSYSWLAIE